MFSPIEVSIRPSRYLRGLSLAAYLSLLCLLLLSSVPVSVQVAGVALGCVGGVVVWRRLGMDGVGLCWDADRRQLSVREPGQGWMAADRVESVMVLPWLLIIRVRVSGRRRRLLIAADSLDSESFRRLAVLARLAPIEIADG